jgi:hypothetical protein
LFVFKKKQKMPTAVVATPPLVPLGLWHDELSYAATGAGASPPSLQSIGERLDGLSKTKVKKARMHYQKGDARQLQQLKRRRFVDVMADRGMRADFFGANGPLGMAHLAGTTGDAIGRTAAATAGAAAGDDPNGVPQTGPARLQAIENTLDSFGMTRSDDQRKFHNAMIQAMIQIIYKNDLFEHLDTLLSRYNCTQLKPDVLIVSPRRWGKTTSVAMFAASVMAVIENLEQAIFSTGRRASRALLELMYAFIMRLPGMKERVVTYNIETLRMQWGPGDVRKLSSFPASVDIGEQSANQHVFLFVYCFRVTRREKEGHSPLLLPLFFVLRIAIHKSSGYYW